MGSTYIPNYLNDLTVESSPDSLRILKITFGGGDNQSSSPTTSITFTSSSFFTTYIKAIIKCFRKKTKRKAWFLLIHTKIQVPIRLLIRPKLRTRKQDKEQFQVFHSLKHINFFLPSFVSCEFQYTQRTQ